MLDMLKNVIFHPFKGIKYSRFMYYMQIIGRWKNDRTEMMLTTMEKYVKMMKTKNSDLTPVEFHQFA